MGSERWFREFERRLGEKLDQGVPEERAHTEAAEEAGPALAEQMFDKADFERKRRREEGK